MNPGSFEISNAINDWQRGEFGKYGTYKSFPERIRVIYMK